MRYLGIDYGTKRVGIAVSNEDGTMAFPYSVIENTGDVVATIVAIATENQSETIVLGESKDLDWKDNPLMEDIRALRAKLEGLGYVVILEPEFLTSHQAAQIQGEGDMHDASAAALILTSYLSKQ